MTSPRRLDPALVLLIAMLAALPALAWLQYSWIGEVEKADADRMRATLQRSSDQLSAEVDSELGRFYRSVLSPGHPGSGLPPVDPCQAFARWQTTAAPARWIRGLYIRDPDNRLFQCSAETGERSAVELPDDLKVATRLWQRGPGPGPRPAPGEDTLPLMVAMVRPPRRPEDEGSRERHEGPGPPGMPTIAFAALDLRWMSGEWLPELVRRSFGDPETSDSVVLVETTASHAHVFDSGAWGGAAADASAQLLRVPGMFGAPDSQGPPPGYWTLLVRRKEGSVAAVAATVRVRNLAVSTAVLALMAVALALLLVTIRRQRRLAQQQMEFVAGVSHELRTPVAVLSSAGENLADGIVTAPASVREYGAMIRDESRRLAGMIEQTLRFAGIQSGGAKYKRQSVDVPQVIDSALRNYEALLRESGCAVELDIAPGLPSAEADSAALAHCIGNLLSNAARYAASGKSITVRAHLDNATDTGSSGKPGMLFIDVEDLGPGIDSRDVPHLFEPFYRGRHSRERQIQGTGLGLALVKRIMEDLGGRVELRTAKGQGSQFRLVVPVAPSAAAPG
ncbi:MAG: HAMP domain-containing sensor histidine kinase [Terracidiphilus sp.]|jgi:signal transduction histidine kinase